MNGLGLFVGLPLLVLAAIAAVEAAWLARRGVRYDWKGYWASFGDAAGRALLGLLIQGGVVGVLLFAIWEFRLTTIAMDRPWHWLALFVGQEFCYYWMHRADHRVRWFWLNHSVHHSATQYNLSTAYRLGWTGKLTGAAITATHLAGDPITARLSEAPGNGAAVGGVKVVTERAWFAARPSGTENVYKIYAESFVGDDHLRQVQAEAKEIVDGALA